MKWGINMNKEQKTNINCQDVNAQDEETRVQKMFEPTIDNAIKNMRWSKILHITKDRQFYSPIANEYMEDKKKFLPFIIPEKQEEFMRLYWKCFEDIGTQDDATIAYRLLNWEHSGDVMMLLNSNTNWYEVDKLIARQGHTGQTMSMLTNKIIKFSAYGLEFLEHVYGTEARQKVEKELKEKAAKK